MAMIRFWRLNHPLSGTIVLAEDTRLAGAAEISHQALISF
jgi:hypothetical protein